MFSKNRFFVKWNMSISLYEYVHEIWVYVHILRHCIIIVDPIMYVNFVCKHTHLFGMMCHLYFSGYKLFNYTTKCTSFEYRFVFFFIIYYSILCFIRSYNSVALLYYQWNWFTVHISECDNYPIERVPLSAPGTDKKHQWVRRCVTDNDCADGSLN